MKAIFSLAVLSVTILIIDGEHDKLLKPPKNFRNGSSKINVSPLLRKIRSSTLEQELFPASDNKQSDASDDEIGAKLMDDFIYFLTLKDSGLLDMCLSFRK
ncbi:uncharacterized protein LOC133191425 [Saccostrea echinata]|uniref:uncharacterized protein LOC133191425 n=1 Tax=Saccostrea echinata TaxID=191078 RepID=UPI002A8086BB|nr:uncharacterized protein LOC133191425 [Saccostrea echinata]